jgi:hypothetical protein
MKILRYSVVILLLVACGAATGEEGDLAAPTTSVSLQPDTTDTMTSQPVTSEPPIELDIPEPRFAEEQALADLAQRLAVAKETIEVASVETGVWSDGSIGCPEEGMLYTQALVPGTRVVLGYDGETYIYHQGGAEGPFLCESPKEGSFVGAEGDALIPPPGYTDNNDG